MINQQINTQLATPISSEIHHGRFGRENRNDVYLISVIRKCILSQLWSSIYHQYKLKYKKVGVLPIWIVKSNVSSVVPYSERRAKGQLMKSQRQPSSWQRKDQRSKRQTLLSVSAVHRPFLHFVLYLYFAYAEHYVYITN